MSLSYKDNKKGSQTEPFYILTPHLTGCRMKQHLTMTRG